MSLFPSSCTRLLSSSSRARFAPLANNLLLASVPSSSCVVAPVVPTPTIAHSFHSATINHFIFDSPEVKAEKTRQKEQQTMKAGFQKLVEIMAKDNFNMGAYEEIIKLQSGEAPATAGWVDRTRYAIGQKVQSWQGKETPAELKKMLAFLAELTPAEKANSKGVLSSETKERISKKLGETPGDIALHLARYDQFLSMSEWMAWRRKNAKRLPVSMQDMQDLMKEDRKMHKMPRFSKMDIRQRQIQKGMVHTSRKM